MDLAPLCSSPLFRDVLHTYTCMSTPKARRQEGCWVPGPYDPPPESAGLVGYFTPNQFIYFQGVEVGFTYISPLCTVPALPGYQVGTPS